MGCKIKGNGRKEMGGKEREEGEGWKEKGKRRRGRGEIRMGKGREENDKEMGGKQGGRAVGLS